MLSQRLAILIDTLDVTQVEFAERIGYTPSYINMLLKNSNDRGKKPSIRFFNSLYQVYHVNAEWMQNGTGDMFECKIDYCTYDDKYNDFLNNFSILQNEEKECIINLINLFLKNKIK